MAAVATNQPFYYGPGSNPDTMQVVASHLGLADVIACAGVSKAWNNSMKYHNIWVDLFDTEKVPRVPGRDVKTPMEDFQHIYPRTLSARKMAPLGRFVGIVPPIDPVIYETFKTAVDSYEPTQKMDRMWVYVVKPEYIHREYDQELVERLKAEGDFDASAETSELKEKGLLIPFTFKNLRVVANYVGSKKGVKVIGSVDYDFLLQCSKVSNGTRVTLMRKEVPESTQNKTWTQQKSGLARKRHKPVDLETRALYEVVNILNNKQEENRKTYSRTSTEFKIGRRTYSVAIGSCESGRGVDVYNSWDNDLNCVTPAIPAEVQDIGQR